VLDLLNDFDHCFSTTARGFSRCTFASLCRCNRLILSAISYLLTCCFSVANVLIWFLSLSRMGSCEIGIEQALSIKPTQVKRQYANVG